MKLILNTFFTSLFLILSSCSEDSTTQPSSVVQMEMMFDMGWEDVIEIKNCGGVGIHSTFGASVTLVGSKTKIHHNCQHSSNMSSGGISLSGSASSSVLLVSPLTRESVSFDNRSDRNWNAFSGGDLSNFKTIEEGEI